MYESFFRLHHAPFNLTPDPNLIVLTDAHAEALSNVEYGIARQKGLILLIGVPGAGKTIVIWYGAATAIAPGEVRVLEQPHADAQRVRGVARRPV